MFTIAVSFAYHLSREKRLAIADVVIAWALIASNILLCYRGNFSSPYFELTMLFVAIGVYFKYRHHRKDLDMDHGLWHFFSSLITIFSILTFAY